MTEASSALTSSVCLVFQTITKKKTFSSRERNLTPPSHVEKLRPITLSRSGITAAQVATQRGCRVVGETIECSLLRSARDKTRVCRCRRRRRACRALLARLCFVCSRGRFVLPCFSTALLVLAGPPVASPSAANSSKVLLRPSLAVGFFSFLAWLFLAGSRFVRGMRDNSRGFFYNIITCRLHRASA